MRWFLVAWVMLTPSTVWAADAAVDPVVRLIKMPPVGDLVGVWGLLVVISAIALKAVGLASDVLASKLGYPSVGGHRARGEKLTAGQEVVKLLDRVAMTLDRVAEKLDKMDRRIVRVEGQVGEIHKGYMKPEGGPRSTGEEAMNAIDALRKAQDEHDERLRQVAMKVDRIAG